MAAAVVQAEGLLGNRQVESERVGAHRVVDGQPPDPLHNRFRCLFWPAPIYMHTVQPQVLLQSMFTAGCTAESERSLACSQHQTAVACTAPVAGPSARQRCGMHGGLTAQGHCKRHARQLRSLQMPDTGPLIVEPSLLETGTIIS